MGGCNVPATILIVDDEQDLVDMIKDALEDEGYRVLTATDGNGIFPLLKHQPDLIVLDIMMPGLDGIEVCRAIRETVACPILFLSARREVEDRIEGLTAGGDDYLTKPFSLRELKARIAAHLRREQRSALGQGDDGPPLRKPDHRSETAESARPEPGSADDGQGI
jgi:DNA-binding response OmpR family regulator